MLGKGWFPDQLGGLDRYFRGLLEQLPEAAGLVIGPAAVEAEPAGTARGRLTAVSRHEAPLPLRLLAGWRAAQRTASEAEIVDAHFALYAVLPILFGRSRQMPLIVHFHGPWTAESIASGDQSRARRMIREAIERAVYRRADHAVTLTSAFRQVLVERYGVLPWRVSVQPPGVDLKRFKPGSRLDARTLLNIAPEAFVAVTVRRLVPRMGLAVLIDAWAKVSESIGSGSQLLIAGDGPLRSELESTIQRRALSGSVRLLGRVSDETLTELYRAADVCVVPSLEHEGFGLVVIEAAACGTPSIVTDAGGLPEAIAPLDPRLIVRAGDRRAMSRALRAASTRLPTSERTRGFAETYDWAGVAAHHRTLSRRLTGRAAPDGRMKVVYLDHVAQMSGGEIAILRLLPHLRNVNSHVILAETGPLVGELHRVGISTEVLPLADAARRLRRSDVHPSAAMAKVAGTTAAYVLRLARRLRQLRPDLVHTNSLKSGVYGSVAARLAGIPIIWHVRDRIADDYLSPAGVQLVRQMTRRLATAVVANSQATLDTLTVDTAPSVVAYSVLPEVLARRPQPNVRPVERPLTFAHLGRLAPWKGQKLFLRAFARSFPEGDERAVIIGGALFGEDEYEASLVRLVGALRLNGRVELRGHRTDVWSELARADVLVNASLTPEPFGQVILEGLAAGLPVIAGRAGGPAEILSHEHTGLLYDLGDEGALSAAMLRMLDPGLRARLALAGRTELQRYAPSVVAEQLEQLYATIAGRAA